MSYRPRCPECGGFNVQTLEWTRWTDKGPELANGEGPGLADWCEDCEDEVYAEMVDPSEENKEARA